MISYKGNIYIFLSTYCWNHIQINNTNDIERKFILSDMRLIPNSNIILAVIQTFSTDMGQVYMGLMCSWMSLREDMEGKMF